MITAGEIDLLAERLNGIINGAEMFKKNRLEVMLSDVEEAYNGDPAAKFMADAIKEALEEVS